MPSFGDHSRKNLEGVHQDLVRLFERVVQSFDCTVICGRRGEEEQMKAYWNGLSKLAYPESKHNKEPALAVDVVPYPIDWDDRERMYYFAGYVRGVAEQMGIKIRWGGDWDSDTHVNDQTFIDLPHFELLR